MDGKKLLQHGYYFSSVFLFYLFFYAKGLQPVARGPHAALWFLCINQIAQINPPQSPTFNLKLWRRKVESAALQTFYTWKNAF